MIVSNLQGEGEIYAFQGNEYRLTPFKVKRKKVCQFIEDDTLFWPSLSNQSDFPIKCPLNKGTYKIDFTPDLSSLPRSFNGKYKAKIQMYYKNQKAEVCSIYFDIQRYAMG